jgi:hypothetical protein
MKRIFSTLVAFVVTLLTGVADKAHAKLFSHMGKSGLLLCAMDSVPSAADFQSRRVTDPNQSEIVRQRFYDYQLYATAGVAQMTFFAQPIGQGITSTIGGTVGTAKTIWDTNLELPNTLPSGKSFMMESIEVEFFPGSVSTANTYTPATIGIFNATAAAAVFMPLNDVNIILQSGVLELNVLSKNYLREALLKSFPPKAYIGMDGMVASNAAATSVVGAQIARAMGRPYYMAPEIALQPAVNFDVTVKWPAAVATPSGFNGRLGVVLDGYFMRASQ